MENYGLKRNMETVDTLYARGYREDGIINKSTNS